MLLFDDLVGKKTTSQTCSRTIGVIDICFMIIIIIITITMNLAFSIVVKNKINVFFSYYKHCKYILFKDVPKE